MFLLLTDYLRSERDLTWDIAAQCGVAHGVIRLPEDDAFDETDVSHWRQVIDRFEGFGITPVIVEPMPNRLHDHIKAGDERRDECIARVIKMLAAMDKMNVRTVCFNWMAHVGWCRTEKAIPERGGARVTGFDLQKYRPTEAHITADKLWDNYWYFLSAVLPEAEKHGITLALHPDDPPLPKLGDVARIMISADAIDKAMHTVCSDSLGLTMCQATFLMMGERLEEVIPRFRDKIRFVHFRNATGDKTCFHETFHDNGDIDMAAALRLYAANGVDVPIRVDHVPTMVGEQGEIAGYDALGRLFAIGYLKGLLEMLEKENAE